MLSWLKKLFQREEKTHLQRTPEEVEKMRNWLRNELKSVKYKKVTEDCS